MPWLIGVILALAGIVIVLLALIFSSPNGLVASQPTGSEQPSASVAGVDPSSQPSGSGNASPSASGDESSAPTPSQPPPAFGPLEMTYLGRPSAVAPIYLLLRDFSETKDPDVLAQAEQGVSSYANSPDGRVSAAVINARAVALDRGGKARRLADNIRTLTFGWDAETLYAVRITRDGGERSGQDPGDRLRKRRHQAARHHPLPAPGHRRRGAASRRRSSSTTAAWCACTRWRMAT